MIILPINLHVPASSEGKALFALIDDDLIEAAKAHRWVAGKDNRPVRSVYNAQTKKSAPQSLARWVWAKTKDTPVPPFIAHLNGDLLDCRADNIIEVQHPSMARSLHTGEAVDNELVRLYGEKEHHEIRVLLGVPEEGVSAKRGKKGRVSEEHIRQLLDARLTVGRTLSLKGFNAEVVVDIVGERISPLLLSRILKGNVGKIESFDYSSIRPFRVR